MIENKNTEISYFQNTTKMADVLHANYHLLTVLNRFGIKLGFGDKTIEKVCVEYKIDTDFFLLIINTFHNPEYNLTPYYSKVDSEILVDFLLKTHEYYNNVIIPALNQLIKDVFMLTRDQTKSALLQRFYRQYVHDLKEHIEYEEKVAFPYVIMISKVFKKEVHIKEIEEITYRISDFEEEHDDVEEKFYDLKNILIKYYSVPDDELVVHALYLLFRFEKDLIDHARLENKLLVPIVQNMENQLFLIV